VRRYGLRLAVFLILAAALFGQQRITPKEASNHVGEHVTVCGKVASQHYAANTKGQPTFINLDEPYPGQIFTVVIWGSDRPAFGKIPANMCVSGTISLYKGIPEIIARSPSQITPN
jgi:hypothetical protein